MSKRSLKDIISYEKRYMNKLRWGFNYVITPVFIAVSLVCIIVMIVTMSIDDVVYTPLTIVLTIALITLILAFLIFSRVVRRTEIKLEVSKYDFGTVSFGDKEEYVFGDDPAAAFLCDAESENYPYDPEKTEFRFDMNGLLIDGKRWSYDEMRAYVRTSNYLFRVYAGIAFRLSGNYEIRLLLTGEVLKMIGSFGIEIENRKVLDYLLAGKRDAFRQIYDHGRIIKIK